MKKKAFRGCICPCFLPVPFDFGICRERKRIFLGILSCTGQCRSADTGGTRYLLQELDEISQRQKMDIVIATTNSLDGKDVVAYADDLYDECDYGYGEQKDGVLLLISMEDRDWYISTCGYGITAFTDAGIQYIGEQMLSDLSEGDYAAAFDVFAEQCDSFITQARNDEPFDSKHLPREPLGNKWILISIVDGVVLAFLVVGGMKGQLKSVRSKPTARDYLREEASR